MTSRARHASVPIPADDERRAQVPPAPGARGTLVHADGIAVSAELSEWHLRDRSIFDLPLERDDVVAEGESLRALIARTAGDCLAEWVVGLRSVLPGRFHLLPGGGEQRWDLLYVARGLDVPEEFVLTLEIDEYGTFDLRVGYPSLSAYAMHRLGVAAFDPTAYGLGRQALHAAELRLFGERRTLFGVDPLAE